MKPSGLRKRILEGDDDFPSDIREQIDASPEYKALYERTRTIRCLLALKRYERPEPGFDARVRGDIMRRIRRQDAPVSTWAGGWDVLTAPAVPAVRYAVGAVLIVLFAVHFVGEPEVPASRASWSLPVRTVQPFVAPGRLASTNLPRYDIRRLVTVPLPPQQPASPAQIQYGPVESVPVRGDPWTDPAYGRYR